MSDQKFEKLFSKSFSPEPNTGCWIWTGYIGVGGYGHMSVRNRKKTDHKYAHRHSFERSNGPVPHGMIVLHSCDNRWCVNPEHLSVGTHQENMDDMVSRGRSLVNNKNSAKIDIETARKVYMATLLYSQTEVARQFSISQPLVSMIRNGRVWPEVKNEFV
jgi:hypothetical protein